jgi:hypothetical protein
VTVCARQAGVFEQEVSVLYRYTTQRVHLNEIILIDGD